MVTAGLTRLLGWGVVGKCGLVVVVASAVPHSGH